MNQKAEIVQQLLRNRVSLRRFANRELSEEDKKAIIEGAMRAPTAGNMMLYSMLVIEDRKKKQVLSETCDHQPFIATSPFVIVFLADLQRWYDYYLESNVSEYCADKNIKFNEPDEADLLLSSCDALIAAQNAVIAAEARDIGSCYIGDIMENYEIHRDLLDLPPWVFPITLVCFGYYPEGKKPSPRPRFNEEFIVFKDKYKRLDSEQFKEMFQDRTINFNKDNSFNAENYGQFMFAKKTGSAFSAEMARSVKTALENWKGKILK